MKTMSRSRRPTIGVAALKPARQPNVLQSVKAVAVMLLVAALPLVCADYWNHYRGPLFSGFHAGALWEAENKIILHGGDVVEAMGIAFYDISAGRWGCVLRASSASRHARCWMVGLLSVSHSSLCVVVGIAARGS